MNNAAPPQLTFRAVVLAIVLAVVLSAANAYLGLFAGLTVATAIPAAVVSMGVLRLLGGGTILENNIVQTGASAGSSIAAGVIFTIPALILMGYWPDFKYWWVLGIAGLGGLLGVLFSVPLRRSMIVEEPLPFPEGKAAAEVLKAGENPGPGLKILGLSAAIGGVVKLAAANGLKVIPDSWAVAGYFANNKVIGYLGTGLSPALLGVGYIVGLNVGIVVLSGAILSWHIAIPLYHALFLGSDPQLAAGIAGAPAADAAFAIWSSKIRFLGVGAMLVGGVWTLFSLRKSLLAGIKSGFAAARKSAGATPLAETERDLPMKWMLVALVLFVLPLLALYQAIVGQWLVSVPMTIIMIVAGFLFVSVSGYLAGLVGSSNNPVSGITIATILFASVVLLMLLGDDGKVQVGGAPLGAVAAIMIGAVVCCAAAVGGDNLQDLKTGYLVGATPWKQQLMLGIGAFSCALIMAPVLNLLQEAYGIGSKTLPAPQANLMASVAKGLFGGDLPWTMIIIGGGIGAVVIAIDGWLKKTGKRFRVPVLAAAIGIYLPLELMVPIFLGGLLAHLVARFHKVRADDEEALDRVHRPGVLFSAGLITGEALMGIAIALPIVITQNPDVLALPLSLGAAAQWVGLAVLFLVGWLLYRVGRKGEQASPAKG
ncbi:MULTISPECIES: oligopeptide transporter, OPT family [Stenotrophomonas]|uniref:OPT family oligopeptide transporter n=1 Tax=Stenotrophomonas TaxID=40323 RepID=UPI00086C7F87|nr:MULTISPECIES: oligopeptide transporter, OPT family [Stenotrophomonas]ODU47278.1 MAG: oligopeptide transporter, OPT family [Xanthomonadaceae bacterium SCN 69-123]MBN8801567.1 oligopeptide transporter, OPT family [Stenotrophomonas acidaminiphila]MCA7024218.1 oligopeptide transporter, OPT family [Stenotrophomonas acidaminiphila]MCE4074968.1 oligopeptide transporter, OPT family [Stenotrophomonas acidaminiphila]MDF9440783.1 oligopeptide transporter, OPT family [Stenotrophomonas acidaminiphila]